MENTETRKNDIIMKWREKQRKIIKTIMNPSRRT